MDLWSRVRSQVASRLPELLNDLDVQTGKVQSGWISVLCPLCTDTSKSASVALSSGHLKCHQCGASEPFFDWLSKKRGSDPWNVCKDLAQQFGISIKRKRGRFSRRNITAESIDECVTALWEAPEAAHLREELERRGFDALKLAPYYIGFNGGLLMFPIVEPTGNVRQRAHLWSFAEGKRMWYWSGKGADPNSIWPLHIVPKDDDVILLCEGQWDVLTMRENVQPAGIHACCWTGGASSPISASRFPKWFKGRKVIVCYDNDTWQGSGKLWYPERKHKMATERRHKNLLDGVCRSLKLTDCDVWLATVPIPPDVKWGADLRDWYESGGRDFSTLELVRFDEVEPPAPEKIRLDFRDVFLRKDLDVEFRGKVAGDEGDTYQIPISTTINCPINSHPCCAFCRVPFEFEDGIVDWSLHENELAKCLAYDGPVGEAIAKHFLSIPRACPRHELVHDVDRHGFLRKWWISSSNETSSQEELLVSKGFGNTPYGEEVEIDGRVLHRWNEPHSFVAARSVRMVEREDFKLTKETIAKLKTATPWRSNDVEEIDSYLYFSRHDDLSCNVTKIYERPDFHIAFDLVAHSCLWMEIEGKKRRAWVDVAIVGLTRSGKSETARSLWEHYGGMGEVVSAQSNWSLAGLVMGNEQAPGERRRFRLKPGVFPRNHGKLIVLDEFHTMSMSKNYKDDMRLMAILQEIRDKGIAQSVKMAGSKTLPSAVRLITLSNPIQGGRELCESLNKLYETRESVARLDFSVFYTEHNRGRRGEVGIPEPLQDIGIIWDQDLCKALVRRAWTMTPDDIVIDEEVIKIAKQVIAQWGMWASEDIPLYTGHDKVFSLLRVAISVANLCFSHPKDRPEKVLVRSGHVLWAQQWFEHCWEDSGYMRYSQRARSQGRLTDPKLAEWTLMQKCETAPLAMTLLASLLDGANRSQVGALFGLESSSIDRQIHQLLMTRLMYTGPSYTYVDNRRGDFYRPTPEGERLIQAIMHLAETAPEEYARRYQALARGKETFEWNMLEPILEDYREQDRESEES